MSQVYGLNLLDSVVGHNPEMNTWMQITNLPIAVICPAVFGYDDSL